LNDQGIIALAPIPEYKKYQNPPHKSIYLDGISDPGNMGTLIRTAAWFGIKSIFFSPNCVDPFNSKVVRSSMGAHFYFSHFETDDERQILHDFAKAGFEILGSDMNGNSIHSLNVSDTKGWILVLGNEAHGIGDHARSFITSTVSIPGTKGMESLNVSVAGGILLHEITSSRAVTN
jgi:TrmH family RNA methyltransferase